MDGLSDGNAFTARELSVGGFTVARIAEVLDVSEGVDDATEWDAVRIRRG